MGSTRSTGCSSIVTTLALALALALASGTHAHTWVEQMQEIDANGTFTGAMGYPRGYVARTEAGFDGNSMDYLLPALTSGRTRIDRTDLLCHPAQREPNQTHGWPMLTTSPGNHIALKYLENGHVTLPQNQPGKPPGAGTVFVFGTTQPLTNETLDTVLRWTPDGKGGDGRGRLLSAQNFDDGRCHQLNSGAISQQRQQDFPDRVPGQPTSNVEQWCETDVHIPLDADIDVHTLYFVWDWATRPGVAGLPDGKDEYYTTCADVNVVPEKTGLGFFGTPKQESEDADALLQQDPQTLAVKTYASRLAYKTNPLEPYLTAGGTAEAAYATVVPTGVTESAIESTLSSYAMPGKVTDSAYKDPTPATESIFASSAQTTDAAYTPPTAYPGSPTPAPTSSSSSLAVTALPSSLSTPAGGPVSSPASPTVTETTTSACRGWPTVGGGSSSGYTQPAISSQVTSVSPAGPGPRPYDYSLTPSSDTATPTSTEVFSSAVASSVYTTPSPAASSLTSSTDSILATSLTTAPTSTSSSNAGPGPRPYDFPLPPSSDSATSVSSANSGGATSTATATSSAAATGSIGPQPYSYSASSPGLLSSSFSSSFTFIASASSSSSSTSTSITGASTSSAVLATSSSSAPAVATVTSIVYDTTLMTIKSTVTVESSAALYGYSNAVEPTVTVTDRVTVTASPSVSPVAINDHEQTAGDSEPTLKVGAIDVASGSGYSAAGRRRRREFLQRRRERSRHF